MVVMGGTLVGKHIWKAASRGGGDRGGHTTDVAFCLLELLSARTYSRRLLVSFMCL